MVAVPAATPVTSPAEPTVAIAGVEDDHVPPVVASLSVTDEPAPVHRVVTPVIAPGNGFTVTTAVLTQPDTLYEILTAPAATPVTSPAVPTVATAVLLLLHVPPVTVELKVVTDPGQTVAVPVSAGGKALTVTVAVVKQPVESV